MKTMEVIILTATIGTMIIALIGALAPSNSRYAYWFDKNSKCLVTIMIVLFFAAVILWG